MQQMKNLNKSMNISLALILILNWCTYQNGKHVKYFEYSDKFFTVNSIKVISKPQFISNPFYYYPKDVIHLDSLATFLIFHNQIKIEIGVYTDYRGNDNYNYQLSEKQAIKVVEYLINKGVNSSQLYEKGYGENNLIYTEQEITQLKDETKKDIMHEANNRIVIKILANPTIPSIDK